MGIGMALTGCAGLPENVDRPVSRALADPSGTALASMVQEQKAAAKARHPSGFVLLSGAQAAYSSRLALVESAQKTLDLQYYAIHADVSTQRLLQSVVAAAERGVRVRVLLDDLHSTGRDAQVMRLAFVPNVEMRMFNPLTGARNSQLGRIFSLVGDFSRVQQRMHNKLFIADNVMGVTGGRNLGDAYFGNAEAANFVDLDILAVGPIVQDMSRSFDSYWNNPRAYPVQSLITPEELRRIREQTQRIPPDGPQDGEAAAPAAAQPATRSDGPKPPDGEPRPTAQGATAAQRARIWNEQPMDLRTAPFVWAPAVILADRPAKIPRADEPADMPKPAEATPSDGTSATAPLRRSAGMDVTAPAQPGTGPGTARLAAATASAAQGDTVVDGLLQLMAHTQRDLLIISPYFVPGEDMKKAFADARQRGVRVRVLTNSLASNDAPIAHVGYARHREELLAMGLELYELRSEQAGLGSAFGSSGGSATGASRAMLHSKVLVIDGRLLVVGSMNLDLRSQLQNTEIALLVHSPTLSKEAAEQIEAAMRTSAWRVELRDGALVWQAPEGSGLENATHDPDSSLGLRLLLRLFGPLAPDHLL